MQSERLNECQEMNIKEMRRLVMREVRPVYRPVPYAYFWGPVVAGILLAATMHTCHSEARAAYGRRPSADAVMLSADYPLTRRDWDYAQEMAIGREYGKIVGVRP